MQHWKRPAFCALGLTACVVLYVLMRAENRGKYRQEASGLTRSPMTGAASDRRAETQPSHLPRWQSKQTSPGAERELPTKRTPVSAYPVSVPLPGTIEDAIASNPLLAKDLACRDEQAKFSMDYQLRLIVGMRDCLAGRTSSVGRFEFMLYFDNDPATRRSVGISVEPQSSDLTPADDSIVLECLKTVTVGSILMNSAKYGQTDKRYVPSAINLPLEDSYIYKMVREGSYTAGTKYGCEMP